MVWAQEMKNLAAEIKTGHRDRSARIGEIKRETRDILGEADDYIKKVSAELKEMARDVKNFLAKSEENRMKEFNAMMGEIQAQIKEIKTGVKDLLAKSEEKRIADFKTLMRNITEEIGRVKKEVGVIRKETKATLADYKVERKEAAGYWASLRGKKGGKTIEEEAEEKEFRCEVCGKEFSTKIALMGHTRSHR